MILARRAAWERGLDEVLIQNTEGGISEGTTTNIFVVKNGKLYTPPESDGIQLEVSRNIIIDLAKSMDIPFSEKRIGQKYLMNADEVFVTNSLIELMPVREIEGEKIGSGEAGPVFEQLLKGYRALVKNECSQ